MMILLGLFVAGVNGWRAASLWQALPKDGLLGGGGPNLDPKAWGEFALWSISAVGAILLALGL